MKDSHPACALRTTLFVGIMGRTDGFLRPVPAESLANGTYRIVGTMPEGEQWQFPPGELVVCEQRPVQRGVIRLVAVRRVEVEGK